jgi:hypothetical protein
MTGSGDSIVDKVEPSHFHIIVWKHELQGLKYFIYILYKLCIIGKNFEDKSAFLENIVQKINNYQGNCNTYCANIQMLHD